MTNQLTINRVLNRSESGWYGCSLEDGTPILLCYSTIVTKENGIYRVMEGKYKGRIIKPKDSSIFEKTNLDTNVRCCIYDQMNNFLYLPNSEVYKTVPQIFIPRGDYFIGLPIYPNLRLTKREYKDELRGGSRFATTWFPLFDNNKKITHYYLHLGKISHGCITVEFSFHGKDWSKIFLYLLSNRLPEGFLMKLKFK